MRKTLTPKQAKFVKAYVETGNGTQAALQAYDTTDKAVANAVAGENLLKPLVARAIASFTEDVQELVRPALAKAIKKAEQWVDSNDDKLQLQGMNYLKEITRIIAPVTPKFTDNRKLMLNLPK